MAAENFLAKENLGLNHRVKSLTTSASLTTYTAKSGRPADDFVIDRVITVNTTSESSMTITLPNGVYYGQRCLIILTVLGGSATVDVSTTTGDDSTTLTAAGGYSELIWAGGTLGWIEIAASAT